MKKSIYNILFGILGQLITIALGIIIPRLFLLSFGSEMNGFLSSLTNIFAYMVIFEAGIGNATIQALYGPIAKDNRAAINGILAATNRHYTRIGYIYLGAVVLLAVIYPLVIKSDVPLIIVVSVILLMGLGGAINFFLQGKYRLLLQAEGKQYIISNLTTASHTLISVTKIVLILAGFNVVALIAAQFIFTLAQMIYITLHIKRHYNWINLRVQPDEAAISQRNSVMLHQIASLVFYRTDVILLSIFCGLKITSVYVIYNLLFEMVANLVTNINSGVAFKLGQLYNTSITRYKRIFDIYEAYYSAISFGFFLVAYLFMAPFVRLYTHGVTDTEYMLKWLPLFFVTCKILVSSRAPSIGTSNFAGHFRQTQWNAVTMAAINLVVSIAAIKFFGIYGVFIGTIASSIYFMEFIIRYINSKLLQRSSWKSYKILLVNILLFIAIALLANLYPLSLNSYRAVISAGLFATIVIIPLFLVVNSLMVPESFRRLIKYIRSSVLPKLLRKKAISATP